MHKTLYHIKYKFKLNMYMHVLNIYMWIIDGNFYHKYLPTYMPKLTRIKLIHNQFQYKTMQLITNMVEN